MSSVLSPFVLSPVGRACRTTIAGLMLSSAACVSQAATPAQPIIPGERLSTWLARQPASDDSYPTGLRWDVPEERLSQEVLKQRLSQQLGSLPSDKTPSGEPLLQWLQKLPITGRAVISDPDNRYLEVNPQQDPVLQAGQRIELPRRPQTATVVLDDGALCQVPYRAGVLAMDYLRACVPDADQRDVVWIAQPDGRNFRYGTGIWNAQSQEPPGAGAWIWAPSQSSGIPASFSEGLIKLLATQGIAADGGGRPVGAPAEAERVIPKSLSRDLPVTASDFGEIGLIQTPSARMAKVGEVRSTISHVQPYTRATVMFQPLDWLEGGFRYSSINNQLYDPTLTISSQSFKDKSVDVKVRVWEESRWIPQVSAGARDLGGTGLFSGEYVVANKRTGDLDWSVGLGWGYVGARGDIKNPFSFISERFTTRPATAGTGNTGTSNNKAYFRGPTSLFGGIQWQTPLPSLIVKAEYDGNSYKNEPFNSKFDTKLPINFGIVYRYSKNVDLAANVERGNRAALSVTFRGGLDSLASSKLLDSPTPAVQAGMPTNDPHWEATATDVERLTGWSVESISRRGGTLIIGVTSTFSAYKSSRLQKMMAVLHRDVPESINSFEILFSERGLLLGAKQIRRKDWVDLQTQQFSRQQEEDRNIDFSTGPLKNADPVILKSDTVWVSTDGRLRGRLSPSFSQSLGGPDSFLLYQIGIQGSAEYKITKNTWVSAGANFRLFDNYDKFKYTAPSNLPRVRTFAREFAVTSRATITNLQLTHAEQITDNNFGLIYGGLLEAMFGGVGGEYMYRKRDSAWAFGLDLNRVRQRDFDQKLTFREYEVNTGHATIYWDTGWNDLTARISAGQYLAGDRGVTVDLSRRFSNGVTVGAYATKTNVSSVQFGEGSFDKGIYVTFPFDAILPRSTNTSGSILWQPLVRDGGAKLARYQTLYSITNERDPRAFQIKPSQ